MQEEKKLSRLEKLRKQRESIENRIRQVEARENSVKKKQDTRKKILIGAWMIEKLEKEKGGLQSIMEELDVFLKRPLDRQLFGLPDTNNA